jgi:AcrR family transcriptional regulator
VSRTRTRPTRESTRTNLFTAAARLFQDQGIGDTRIDEITEAAGFSRGAFYSNFASKDELIIAMLEDHAERSLSFHRALLAKHEKAQELISALRSSERSDDPLGSMPLLHIELILFVARAKKRRPDLAKRLRARRRLIAEVVTAMNQKAKSKIQIDPAWAASLLVALEDGFRLHRLIDPATTPLNSFFDSVVKLQRLLQG